MFSTRLAYHKLRIFASRFEWNSLRWFEKVFEDGDKLTWYHTTDDRFFLQINEFRTADEECYSAAVYSLRHGICCGFFKFRLSDPIALQDLCVLLRRRNFRIARWRRIIKQLHPEWCVSKPTPKACYRAMSIGQWPPLLHADEGTRSRFAEEISRVLSQQTPR